MFKWLFGKTIEDEFSSIVSVFHKMHDKLDLFVGRARDDVIKAQIELTSKADIHKQASGVLTNLKNFLNK